MAVGKDMRTGADINVVQWLRFGSGAYIHMIAVARSSAWIRPIRASARFATASICSDAIVALRTWRRRR